jgi:CRP-like cAMP-binding protein
MIFLISNKKEFNTTFIQIIIFALNFNLKMGKTLIQTDCEYCSARKGSVFCNLNDDNLKELNVNKACSFYKKGSLIFSEGQRPHGLFCVNNGKVKVFQTGLEGKDQIVRLANSGDILGYRALLSGESYASSAEAIDDASVCFIPREIFFNLLNNDAPLSLEIMKLLSKDLKRAENAMTDLAQKPVRERLAEAILFIKETYGFEEDGITINVVLSREDMANIVGTATETAIRLISDLKSEGIISQKEKKLQILDMNKLVKVAAIND